MSAKQKSYLSLSEELEIIKCVEQCTLDLIQVAEKFKLGETQVADIISNKDLVQTLFMTSRNVYKERRSSKTNCSLSQIEQLLFDWLCEESDKNIPISKPQLKEKASKVARQLQLDTFIATDGWLGQFCRRRKVAWPISDEGDLLIPNMLLHLKNCKNCKCVRDGHEIVAEHGARSRLGLANNHDGLDARPLGYTFVPAGITTARQVDQYYSTLPTHEVPRLGSKGEMARLQRIVKQLPKQDLALTACKFVEDSVETSYQDFISARNEIALDIGMAKPAPPNSICDGCNRSIPNQQVSVTAPRMGKLIWHPACFRCTTCDDLLVDLAYCVYEEKIYCERHYAELLKPRCEGCDELIFSGEYTKAMNKDWHGQHFCCWQCDESLTGQRYVLRDEHPYCVACYESVFANACEKCSRIIGIDSKDLSYKDKHWHEACFLCTTCGESLVDRQFGSKGDRIYCGRCYDEQFASRCDGCHEIFRAGTKKMEYKTRQWHEKCFCCCVCKVPIGTQSFIPREQEIYCAKCYEEKFATRCIKCNKVITSGGVTYKNEPWHRECFTCTHCSKSLAGERFTSRDEKPYCAECFGELFAKRCFACNKPITGIGGTKFISFEDRHWHNDCFFCASCRTSLVGRGFITDQDDIICPECAKQKLM